MSDAGAPPAALRLEGVSASYGGPDVVRGVSLDVRPGEVVALVGPNGAGKTTTLNAISGLCRVTAGGIWHGGTSLRGLPAHRIVASGVAHVPQGRALFGHSTGYENLRLGAFTRRDRKAVDEDITRFVTQWPIAERVLDKQASLMSGGEQQVVAIGRALMSRPKVLLLDEPSLGLAPVLVDQLFGMVRDLADGTMGRVAILLVEQNLVKSLECASRVYVLVNGTVTMSGPARSLSPEEIGASYLQVTARGAR